MVGKSKSRRRRPVREVIQKREMGAFTKVMGKLKQCSQLMTNQGLGVTGKEE
jgi:hypothetical protein